MKNKYNPKGCFNTKLSSGGRFGKTIEAAVRFYKMVQMLEEGQTVLIASSSGNILLKREVIETKGASEVYYDEFVDMDTE